MIVRRVVSQILNQLFCYLSVYSFVHFITLPTKLYSTQMKYNGTVTSGETLLLKTQLWIFYSSTVNTHLIVLHKSTYPLS